MARYLNRRDGPSYGIYLDELDENEDYKLNELNQRSEKYLELKMKNVDLKVTEHEAGLSVIDSKISYLNVKRKNDSLKDEELEIESNNHSTDAQDAKNLLIELIELIVNNKETINFKYVCNLEWIARLLDYKKLVRIRHSQNIKFYIIIYINCLRNPASKENKVYNIICTKENLLIYLTYLKSELKNERNRTNIPKTLNEDCISLKNIFYLRNILQHLKFAASDKINRYNDLCELVIERTLQILAENLRDVSSSIANIMIQYEENNIPLKSLLTFIRNQLSHSILLYKKMNMESKNKFRRLQNDFSVLFTILWEILEKEIIAVLRKKIKNMIEMGDIKELEAILVTIMDNEPVFVEKPIINNINRLNIKEIQTKITNYDESYGNMYLGMLLVTLHKETGEEYNNIFEEIYSYLELDGKENKEISENFRLFVYQILELRTWSNIERIKEVIKPFLSETNSKHIASIKNQIERINEGNINRSTYTNRKVSKIINKINNFIESNSVELLETRRLRSEITINTKEKFKIMKKIKFKINHKYHENFEVSKKDAGSIQGEVDLKKLENKITNFFLEKAKNTARNNRQNNRNKYIEKTVKKTFNTYLNNRITERANMLHPKNNYNINNSFVVMAAQKVIVLDLLDCLTWLHDTTVDLCCTAELVPIYIETKLRNLLAHSSDILPTILPMNLDVPVLWYNYKFRNYNTIFGLKNEQKENIKFRQCDKKSENLKLKRNNNGINPDVIANYKNHLKIADELDKFFESARKGDKKGIKLYLECEMDLTIVDLEGMTVLDRAIQSKHVNFVKYLIEEERAKVTTKQLEVAILHKYSDLRYLLTKADRSLSDSFDAEGTYKTTNKNTLLNIAAETGNCEFFQFLIDQKQKLRSIHLSSAFELACKNGRPNIVNLILNEYGNFLVNIHSVHRALTLSIKYHQINIVPLLLQHISDVNDANIISNFYLAAQLGCTSTVLEFIRRNIDINCQDSDGWSALHHGAHKGCINVVQILIEHKADCKLTNNNGFTPLELAHDSTIREVLSKYV